MQLHKTLKENYIYDKTGQGTKYPICKRYQRVTDFCYKRKHLFIPDERNILILHFLTPRQ